MKYSIPLIFLIVVLAIMFATFVIGGYRSMSRTGCVTLGHYSQYWRNPFPVDQIVLARQSAEFALENGCYRRNGE